MVGGRELCIKQTFCQARGGAVIDTVPELGSTNQRFFFGTRTAILDVLGRWSHLGKWMACWTRDPEQWAVRQVGGQSCPAKLKSTEPDIWKMIQKKEKEKEKARRVKEKLNSKI